MATSPYWNLPYPYQVVFDSLLVVLPQQGMNIDGAAPEHGQITAKTGINLATWGENLRVHLWYLDEHWTAVQVTSELKFGLFDWGKNDRNLTKLNDALVRHLDTYFIQLRAPNV